MKQQQALSTNKIQFKFSERHIKLIKLEFEKDPRKRDIKTLDSMMKHLSYLKKLEPSIRKQIYKKAKLVNYERQCAIFRAGDVGDNMYIILKGKISVQKQKPQYPDIAEILTTLNDGDAFGELALINMNEIKDN